MSFYRQRHKELVSQINPREQKKKENIQFPHVFSVLETLVKKIVNINVNGLWNYIGWRKTTKNVA